MPHLVEAGAHHLRLAAQAVRVLHAVVVFQVRAADGAAFQQRAVGRGAIDLPRLAAHGVDARVERAVAAARGIERERAGDDRGFDQAVGAAAHRAPARSTPACR
jgi:hypothetical protein